MLKKERKIGIGGGPRIPQGVPWAHIRVKSATGSIYLRPVGVGEFGAHSLPTRTP